MSPARTREIACPVCDAPASPAHQPFCGQGCRDRDLIRWLSDGYRLPDGDARDGDDEALATALDRRWQTPL